MSDQFITKKMQERERVISQMAKLQEQLHSIDADIEMQKAIIVVLDDNLFIEYAYNVLMVANL